MRWFAAGLVLLGFAVMPAVAAAADADDEAATLWVEGQTLLMRGGVEPRAQVYAAQRLTERFGVFGFAQAGERYAQFYAGPTFSPAPRLKLGIGAGAENADDPLRLGGFLWAGNEAHSLLLAWENGGSGFWYKAEFNKAVTPAVGAGFLVERSAGAGPRVEWNIPKTPLQAWGAAPLFEWETGEIKMLFGLRVKF